MALVRKAPWGQPMLLRHGTTLKRAKAILKNGPDANFREPGSEEMAFGFSAVPEGTPPIQETPECYAKKKAKLFPDEDGPAILQFELPDRMASTMIAEEGQLVPGKAWFPGARSDLIWTADWRNFVPFGVR